MSPQIRAVEGLTYAVKGKKVIYKTETWVLPFMSPVSFLFLDCGEVGNTCKLLRGSFDGPGAGAGGGGGVGFRGRVELLIVDSGIGGPLGGSGSWLKCIASFTVRVLPLMKYFPYFVFQIYVF